jgi:hypothetical protein
MSITSSALKYLVPRVNKYVNNGVEALIPDYTVPYWGTDYGVLTIDPRKASVFTVDMSLAVITYTSTINDRLDVFGHTDNSYPSKPFYYFGFNLDQTIAVENPGLEFTVCFNSASGTNPYSYVGVYPDGTLTTNNKADMLSPALAFGHFDNVTITLKSDGTRFRVVNSGPVTWSGAYDW